MEKRIFKSCCGLTDYNIINKLIELSWIRDIDGKLSIHTLIKETVKISCKPDLIKCRDFINCIMEEIPAIEMYYGNYKYKNEIFRIVMHIYNVFSEPQLQLWEFYEWIDLIVSHYSRYDISLQIAEKLYNLYKPVYGENHFRTARMIVRIGAAKRKHNDVEETVSLMEKGREIILNLENRTDRETLLISDIDVSLTNAFITHYDIADNEELLDKNELFCLEAISIRKNLEGQFPYIYVTLIPIYCNLSLIKCYRKNYEEAVYYLELAEKECEKSDNLYLHSIKDSVHSKLALAQGDIQKAAQYQKSAIEKHILCFSEYDISTINMRTTLGDIYMRNPATSLRHINSMKLHLNIWKKYHFIILKCTTILLKGYML